MNRLIMLLCGLTLAVSMPLFGQNRDFQAQRLVLDDDGADGVRNTMTLQSPSLLPLNTIISIPNPGLPGASLLLTESLLPQTVNASLTFTGVVDFTTSTVVGLNSLTDGTTLLGTGIPLNRFRLNMAHANNWIAPQNFNAVNVDGGTINGTSIGGTTPSSGAFTTLESNGATQFGNGVGPDNLTISLGTGNLTIAALQSDNSPTAVLTYNGSGQVRATSIAALAAALGGSTAVVTDGTLTGDGSVGTPLGLNLAAANLWSSGTTFGNGDAGDATTFNTSGGTDLVLGEDGIDRSSGVDETFTFENSGGGDLNVVVNGDISGTGDLAITGGAVVGGGMTVSGAVQLNGGATVNGATALNGNTGITGDLSNTGDADLATGAGSSATIGNTTGVTTLEGSDIDIGPVGPGAIDIGNGGSTTTLNGAVVFTQAPTLPLSSGALLRGDGSGEAAELAAGANGEVLTVVGGTPTWASAPAGSVQHDGTLTGDGTGGSPLGIDLSGSNAWTAQQTFSDVDINGGGIDGTPIGGAVAAAGAFTSLTSNGASTFGDGDGDDITLDVSDPTTGGNLLLDVTNGTLELDGLTQNNGLSDILVVDAGGVVHTRTVASLGGGGWSLSGNGGTTPGTDFLGTTDNVALVVKTNNSERIRILATGEVGIGASAPSQKLELRDGNLLLSNTGSAGEIRFAEPGGTDYTAFRATTQTGSVTYTLPPADGADGNVLATDGSGGLAWVNPNQSGSVGSELFASKGGDETITNNGTLQNDDDLVLAMEASTTYSVEGFLYIKANVNNADINIGFTIPTGGTMKMTYVAYDGANNIKGGGFVTTSGTASGAIDVNTSTTTDIAIWFRGIVRVSTTAGNLQLQWAQDAPGGGRSTTVELDSFMEAKRVQ